VITDRFDDGGYTGGNMDRPALKRLLAAVEARSVDCIVVYKVDRLSRSLREAGDPSPPPPAWSQFKKLAKIVRLPGGLSSSPARLLPAC
jgi:hypothetical protein